MTKECLGKCPRIQKILNETETNNFLSGPMPLHPDLLSSDSAAERLLEAAEDSYDCPGPKKVRVKVTKGILRIRTVTETRWVCGLDKESSEK